MGCASFGSLWFLARAGSLLVVIIFIRKRDSAMLLGQRTVPNSASEKRVDSNLYW